MRRVRLVLVVVLLWPHSLLAIQQDEGQRGVSSQDITLKRSALVIGISGYLGKAALPHANADAKEFARTLQVDVGLDEKDVRLLVDPDATTLNRIRRALDDLAKERLDVAYLYFAGHGVGDQTAGYLLPADVKFDQMTSTSLSLAELQSKLDRIRAKNIILIVDVVHDYNVGSALKLSSSMENQIVEHLKAVARDLRRVSLISATSTGELCKVDPITGQGVFTRELIRGLKGQADVNSDDVVQASELSRYVREQVARETGNQQQPECVVARSNPGLATKRTDVAVVPEGSKSTDMDSLSPPKDVSPPPPSPTAAESAPRQTEDVQGSRTDQPIRTADAHPVAPPEPQPKPQPEEPSTPKQPTTQPPPQPAKASDSVAPPSTNPTTRPNPDPLAPVNLRERAYSILRRYKTAIPPTGPEWQEAGKIYVSEAEGESDGKKKEKLEAYANFCLAQAALCRKDYEFAVPHLEEVVRLDSRYVDAQFALGQTYFELGDYERAVRRFQFIISDLGQDDIEAHHWLAFCYERLGQLDKAEAQYRHILRLSPKELDVIYSLGLLYYSTQRYADAIERYTEALKVDSKRAEIYYARALAYEQQGNHGPAMADYQRALELDPTGATAGFDPNLLRGRIQQLKAQTPP